MSSHARSRVAVNAFAGTVAQIVILGVGFLTTPVLLQSLGATHYGAFALVGSLTAYFGILDFGIGASLTRFMAFYHERAEYDRIASFATFGLSFYVGFALLLLPAVIWLAPYMGRLLALPADLQLRFPVLLAMIFALFIGWSIAGILVARLAAAHRLDIPAFANIGGSLLFAVLVFLVVPKVRSIEGVLTCMAVQLAFVGALLYLANRRLNGPLLQRPSLVRWHDTRELFSFGLWTQAANISAVVNLEADKAIISRSIGVAQVTPYQVGNRLALLSRALPLQLLGSLLPTVTAEVSRGVDAQDLARMYEQTARSIMLPTLAIVGFVAGGADALLRLWLGVDMPDAGLLCAALATSYAINNVTGAGTIILKARGTPQLETFYGILSAVLNVGLTVTLIAPYGLLGVVIGTIAGNVIGSLTFIYLFHRRESLSLWSVLGRWLFKAIVIAVVSGFLVHIGLGLVLESTSSRFFLLLGVGMAGVTYLAVYYILGRLISLWVPEDEALISSAVARLRGLTRARPGEAG